MATLKETLEAKKQEESKSPEIAEEKKEDSTSASVPESHKTQTAEEIAASLGLKEVPKFRVMNFAYEFKTGSKVLKADKFGVYEPADAADFDYLAWQVKQGRILFN